MPRKLIAIVSTGVAAVLVVGSIAAFALVHQSSAKSPRTSAASGPTGTAPHTVAPSNKPSGPPSTPIGAAGTIAGAGRVVYLTFDDGPDPAWTPQILATLAKYNAKATFFQLGSMVTQHPGLQEQIRAAGHAIGNHSISHAQLTAISGQKRHHEIFDGPQSRCFRPPYGATNAKVRADIKAAGMKQILWDIDPRDWAKPGKSAIVQNVMSNVHPGAVILMHDGGGDRTQTVAALETILQKLKQQGYGFIAMNC
ncbi:polysaccharide deacetylase family protein [Kribbella deserti]|uniref:Polysaccharide deacetylase family protein n=1 Tax=Kribbella deserti TaxID=1926257 RepID=A0ABV6QQL9_9ACTN